MDETLTPEALNLIGTPRVTFEANGIAYETDQETLDLLRSLKASGDAVCFSIVIKGGVEILGSIKVLGKAVFDENGRAIGVSL